MTLKIDVLRTFDLTRALPSQRDLKVGMERAITRIKGDIGRKTERGVDFEGKRFKPYSKFTKALKQATGRRVDPPNLTQTGQMLANMSTRATSNLTETVGEIFFVGAFAATKAEANNETRRFFDLTDKQVDRVQQDIDKVIGNVRS